MTERVPSTKGNPIDRGTDSLRPRFCSLHTGSPFDPQNILDPLKTWFVQTINVYGPAIQCNATLWDDIHLFPSSNLNPSSSPLTFFPSYLPKVMVFQRPQNCCLG